MRLLVPAGAQTTYRTLTNILFALLSHPEQYALVREDPSLIPKAVEEGLRWEAPLMSFGRIADPRHRDRRPRRSRRARP